MYLRIQEELLARQAAMSSESYSVMLLTLQRASKMSFTLMKSTVFFRQQNGLMKDLANP